MRGDIPILQNAIASLQRNYAETYKRMYELNTAQQKEIDDLKKVILTLLPQVKSLEKRIGSILGENIEKYIDEWLDNHKQEIIDAIGEGVFVPWKDIKNAEGTEAQAGTPIYTKDAVDSLLGNKANKTDVYTKTESNNTFANKNDVYTKTEVESKLNNKVNLSQIDNGSSSATSSTTIYSTSQTYSKTEADNKYIPKTSINTTHQASGHDGELYSVGYINSLISANASGSTVQTYTAAKIDEMISSIDPGDNYVKWSEVKTAESGDSHLVYSTTEADSLFVKEEELISPKSIEAAKTEAVTHDRMPELTDVTNPKIFTASVVMALVQRKLPLENILGSKTASSLETETKVYNVNYINSLISDDPSDSSNQTYTADKIDDLIQQSKVTDEHIIDVGDERWIKRSGGTEINNVILTPADGDDSKLTLQLIGSTSNAGTIYVPNVQGWKTGDWN